MYNETERDERAGKTAEPAVKKPNIFARFFLFLGALQEKKKEGFFAESISSASGKADLSGKVVRPLRLAVARECEQSLFLRLFEKIAAFLLYAPLRMYGTALFVFSLGAALVENARYYLANGAVSFIYADVWAGVGLLLSLFLLLSSKKKTLALFLDEGRITSYLLFDLLALERRRFEEKKQSEERFLFFVITGGLLAALTALVPVRTVFAALCMIVFARMALLSPESGLLLSVALLPLMPNAAFEWLLGISLFSYVFKCLRGKRNPRRSFYFGIFCIFALLLFFAAVIKPFGSQSNAAWHMLVYLIGGFLAGQTMGRKEFVRRCGYALTFASFWSSLWTVVVFLLKTLPGLFGSEISFSLPETLPGFENAEFFGVFAAISLPFFAVHFFEKKRIGEKLLSALALPVVVAAVILCRAPAAWCALLCAALFALVLIDRRHLITAGVTVLAIVAAGLLLPEFVKNEIKGFSAGFSVDPETVASQLRQSASRLFFAAGDAGALPGANLYSSLLSLAGLIGICFFLFGVIGAFACAYRAHRSAQSETKHLKMLLRAFCTAFFSLLIAGVFCDLSAGGKTFYLIFFLAGMLFAAGRALKTESDLALHRTENDIDVVFALVRTRGSRLCKKKDAPAPCKPNDSESDGEDEP